MVNRVSFAVTKTRNHLKRPETTRNHLKPAIYIFLIFHFFHFSFLFFNGVPVSSTLTLPVNNFTWKKEKPYSPGATKIFVPLARIELATFRILDRTF